jgi:hypothetical protein
MSQNTAIRAIALAMACGALLWSWIRMDTAAARAEGMSRHTAQIATIARELERLGSSSGGLVSRTRITDLPKIIADAAEEAGVLARLTQQTIDDRPAGRTGTQIEAGRVVTIRDATLDQLVRFAALVMAANESLRVRELNLDAVAPSSDAAKSGPELWSADLTITYLRAKIAEP